MKLFQPILALTLLIASPVIAQDIPVPKIDGDWQRICLAKSLDGKNFERVLGGNGQPDLFSEFTYGGEHFTSHARDPMVLKRGNTYYCYYTTHVNDPVNDGAAFCRTSLNVPHT